MALAAASERRCVTSFSRILSEPGFRSALRQRERGDDRVDVDSLNEQACHFLRQLEQSIGLSRPKAVRAAQQIGNRFMVAYPLSHLYGHFGLIRLSRLGHDVPRTKA